MDNGTPKSHTLEVVKSMGYTPVAISLLEGEEVFVFKTQEEASLVEEDFSPEGIWLGEKEFCKIPKTRLKEVYDLVEKKIPIGVTPKVGKLISADQGDAVIGLEAPLKSSITGNVYVFTGFRSPALKGNVIAMGGSVEDRVTNRTTHLIMKNTSSITSKSRHAVALGATIMSLADFNKALQTEAIKLILGI